MLRFPARYFCQADFFGTFTALKSLPPAGMPSPLHFVHQTPFSCGPRQEIEKRSCLLMRSLSQAARTSLTKAWGAFQPEAGVVGANIHPVLNSDEWI